MFGPLRSSFRAFSLSFTEKRDRHDNLIALIKLTPNLGPAVKAYSVSLRRNGWSMDATKARQKFDPAFKARNGFSPRVLYDGDSWGWRVWRNVLKRYRI